MTAQANTDAAATAAQAQATPQQGQQQQAQQGAPAQAAAPQPQATPDAGQTGLTDAELDQEIQRAEKQRKDKLAYLEKLRGGELPDLDSQIGKARKEAERRAQSAAPPEPQQQQQTGQPAPQATTGDAQTAAAELGISDDEFIRRLNANDGTAVAKLVEVSRRGMVSRDELLADLPRIIQQAQTQTQTQERVYQIRDQLDDSQFQHFQNAFQHYTDQGFRPTPDHLFVEAKYGSMDLANKLAEIGTLVANDPELMQVVIERQKAQAQPGPQNQLAAQQQQQQTQQGQQQAGVPVRRFPMAPGGGSPSGPGSQQQAQEKPTLRGMGWNV